MLALVRKGSFKNMSSEKSNTSWLFLEKIISMTILLMVNVLLARELGPEKFGIINYVLAFSGFIALIAPVGLNAILVKEFLKDNVDNRVVFGTAFTVRIIGASLCLTAICIAVYFNWLHSVESKYLILTGISGLFTSFYFIDFWFQSKVKSKYCVLVRTVNLMIFTFIKLLLLYTSDDFDLFLKFIILEPVVLSVGYFIILFYDYKSIKWGVDIKYGLNLLKKSWWLLLSSIAAVICLKIDQIMLSEMVGNKELGIYSVAVRLSEVWYFFPTAIVSSFFPMLIKLKQESDDKYQAKLQWLCDRLFVFSILIAVLVTFTSGFVIRTLYGEQYEVSSVILNIHIWGAIFVFMRALFSKWIITEEVFKYSLITHGVSAVFNVILNIILIPQYFAVGAAIATVMSYFIGSYILLFFNKETKPFFIIMTKSMNLAASVKRSLS